MTITKAPRALVLATSVVLAFGTAGCTEGYSSPDLGRVTAKEFIPAHTTTRDELIGVYGPWVTREYDVADCYSLTISGYGSGCFDEEFYDSVEVGQCYDFPASGMLGVEQVEASC